MAGAENRAPDTGEQRAECRTNAFSSRACELGTKGCEVEHADPASVLAALLAEHPDATIAALKTLLTSDEAERAAGDYFAVAKAPTIEGILSAACRSLRPNTPSEDRDA